MDAATPESEQTVLGLLREAVVLLQEGYRVSWQRDEQGRLAGFQVALGDQLVVDERA